MSGTSPKPRKKSARLWQLVQFVLAVAGLVLLLQWWHLSQKEGQRLFAEQSAVLMREQLKALAQTCAYLIDNDQLDGLQALVKQMATNPYLHDVMVYDANGVKLAESGDSDPARLLYAPQQKNDLLPMVQEIYQGEQLRGYLKVSLLQGASFAKVSVSWGQLMHQLLWMLGFAGVITLMLRSSLQWLSHWIASDRTLKRAATDAPHHNQLAHQQGLISTEPATSSSADAAPKETQLEQLAPTAERPADTVVTDEPSQASRSKDDQRG